jgi:preprotein translocase subunit SecD
MGWNEIIADRRVKILGAILLLALVHFGIEFEGGTRIPVTLERPAQDATEMSTILETIKTRVSKFGLTQVVVRGVGASQVYVEVPQSDQQLVLDIEKILREVGRFEGVVDGKVAISGNDILRNSIRTETGDRQWAVSFTVTSAGAKRFGQAVFGKANYPLYMFLDRPEEGVVLGSRAELFGESAIAEEESLETLQQALRKDDSAVLVLLRDDWNKTRAQLMQINVTNSTVAIIGEGAPQNELDDLHAMHFKVQVKSAKDMKPVFATSDQGSSKVVSEWPAVGLLSSPFLNPSLTQGGTPGLQYQVTGASKGATPQERIASAESETKQLKSVLSGGELPTNIILGSVTTIPAPLGAEFLRYSVVGALGALIAIGLLVVIRYRETRLIAPIILTSAVEIVILVSIIGAMGTIDLATMAGIIAAIGVSVDSQLVITDELLKKGKLAIQASGEVGAKLKLERAFYIVMTNATVAVVAMLPLLFSGLVEISGFATSTILGALLGVFITRPAYGAAVEHIFFDEPKKAHHGHGGTHEKKHEAQKPPEPAEPPESVGGAGTEGSAQKPAE